MLTNWEHYLAPWIVRLIPLSAHQAMLVVGVIEIVAGVAVAVKPRYAAYIVAPGWPGSSSTSSATRGSMTSPCATSGSCSPR
ncbi:MAG TPA: hypothetical protein VF256_09230 [Streptosporangiaceae bacterium]